MDKYSKSITFLVFAILSLVVVVTGFASETSTDPDISPSGEKVRVGYAEGEPWGEFAGTLYALVIGMQEQGIISGTENIPYEYGQFDSREMWQWLADNARSDYLEFVEDAYYSFSEDDPEAREELLSRLIQGEEIDLMLSMGTESGRLLAVDDHQVPTLNFSSSNAVQGGIVDSSEDSGKDHIWAHMDPGRYGRQLEVLHDIFEFEQLGIVYEDSHLGRSFADVPSLQQVAISRGFELVSRHVDEPYPHEENNKRYYRELMAAHQELSGEVDAMLVAIASIEVKKLPELMQPFYRENVPTFSQLGVREVEYGVLMTVAQQDFMEIGMFGVDIVQQVIMGTLPRDLPQVFVDTPKIILNLEATEKIGYKPPFEILLVADEVFRNIEGK